MTFFGLTFLGYQCPFRERRLELAKYDVPEDGGSQPFWPVYCVRGPLARRVPPEVVWSPATFQHEFHFFFSPSSVGTPSPKLELFYPKLPPIGPAGYDGTVHQGSHKKYQEAIKRVQLQKYPNQMYRVPLTCGQDIGWWLPKELSVSPEVAAPWMRVQRHPQLRSPMTKFIDSMSVTNPLFSLF